MRCVWHYAVWGLLGAAVVRGLVFLEASQRTKGWPWVAPDGPGGGVFAVAQLIHLGVATAVTAAVASTALVTNALVAFGIGAAAPAVVKKVTGYTLALLPRQEESGRVGGDGA